jgi:hypothetical protein
LHYLETFLQISFPNWTLLLIILLAIPFYEYLISSVIWRVNAGIALITTAAWYFDYAFRHKIRYESGAGQTPNPNSLNHPRNAMPIYREIYACTQLILCSCRNFVCVLEVALLLICSFLLYFSAGYRGPFAERLLAFTGLLGIGLYSTYVFQRAGNVKKQSYDALKTWKYDYICGEAAQKSRGREWEIERRVLGSLQPIRIYCGTMYFLDEEAAIVLWHQIIDKSILFLCTFPLN